MRRIVRDYIAAAIDRVRPQLERFMAGHLEVREPFPLVFDDAVASISEVRSIKITPRFPADYPPWTSSWHCTGRSGPGQDSATSTSGRERS